MLGGVRLHGPAGDVRAGGERAERLLGALVVAEGAPVLADILAEVIWPEGPPDDPTALRMAVSRLRKRMAEVGLVGAIENVPRGYRLSAPPNAVDSIRFSRLVEEATHIGPTDPDRAAAMLGAALALWRGEPFGSLAGDEWNEGCAARLREQRLEAEEELAELDLRRRREDVAITRLQLAVEEAPLRERRWCQLAVALFRLGRQAEALHAIDRLRHHLREELGLSPGPEAAELERRLLDHDPSLFRHTRPDPGTWTERTIVGRDADLATLAELVRSNTLVTVHGLGGVGKTTMATEVAALLERDGVITYRIPLEGTSSIEEVWSAIGEAVGLPGADDPDVVPDTVAHRLRRDRTLVLLDGAEHVADAVADVADALATRSTGARLLVTSRVPVGASAEVRLAVGPLAVGRGEEWGPAENLLAQRAGLTRAMLDDDACAAVSRLCTRLAGLPLAIELAAASLDLHGLDVLAAERVTDAEEAVRSAVGWAFDVLPEASRPLLVHACLLPNGLSASTGASAAGIPADRLRRAVAPLLQSRLLVAGATDAGEVRYRVADAVRDVMLSLLDPEEREAAETAIVGELVDVCEGFGPVLGPPDLSALPAAVAELGNVRHWLARTVGTPEGHRLASAVAHIFVEVGLSAEAVRWLRRHGDAAPDVSDHDRARWIHALARSAEIALPPAQVEEAIGWATDAGDDLLRMALSGRLAVSRMWSGDLDGAEAVVHSPELRASIDALDDEWLEIQRQQLSGLLLAARGEFDESQTALEGVPSRLVAIGDPSSAMHSWYLRAYVARLDGDLDAAGEHLAMARELAWTGANRVTQAMVMNELAHLARHRGDASAPVELAAAIEELERVGNLRMAAEQRGELAMWLLADGEVVDGATEVARALPVLLRTHRGAAAVALAELAATLSSGEAAGDAVGARLARAARDCLASHAGPGPTVERQARVAEVAASLAGDGAEGCTDEELLALVGGFRRR